jgi:hypothetical protein
MSSSPKVSTFNPLDFFSFASWCYDVKPAIASSSLIRTIINRAYYAALISAREATKISTKGSDGHTNVVTALRRIDVYAANKLDSLRLKRRKADYELNCQLTDRDAMISLGESREVLYNLGCSIPPGKPYSIDYLDHSRFLTTNTSK